MLYIFKINYSYNVNFLLKKYIIQQYRGIKLNIGNQNYKKVLSLIIKKVKFSLNKIFRMKLKIMQLQAINIRNLV